MADLEENVIKRVLPNSLEAEQSVIGAMFLDRDAILTAAELLVGEDFYGRQYGVLFDTMTELNDEGKPVDTITLQERLREKNAPPEISSLDFLREIIASVPTSANVGYYAQIVREKAVLRRMIRANEEIANICYLGNEGLDDVLDEAEKKIFNVVRERGGGEFVPIRQIALNAISEIERAGKSDGNVTGLATGFSDLDYKTAGLQPSDLILIAARPSMGKTAFALNIAEYVAVEDRACVAVFSLEMSKEQLVKRLFAMESRVDSQKLRTGNLEDSEWESLLEGANTIGRSKLIIDDTPGITVAQLRSKCRKYKLEHDLKLIVIDYLQLMSAGGRVESRQQEISGISRSLKALARELEVPVVALSQLSRAVEQRDDKKPMLSDLRESGAIEQDADVVMFIYRDEYYNPETTSKKGLAEIIIAKQRNGPTGTVNLTWLPQYTKFVNRIRPSEVYA